MLLLLNFDMTLFWPGSDSCGIENMELRGRNGLIIIEVPIEGTGQLPAKFIPAVPLTAA